jgi:cytochrome c-type biogenesis protein CcsB
MTQLTYILFLVALIGYCGSSFLGFLNLFSSKDLGFSTRTLLVLSWILHTFALIILIDSLKRLPINNMTETLNFLIWGTVLISIFLQKNENLKTINVFITPGAALGMYYFLISFHRGGNYAFDSFFWLNFHVISVLISFIFLILSFFFALIYLLQTYLLKHKKIGSPLKKLPSLELCEAYCHYFVSMGFLFLTLAITSGALWSQKTWGSFWLWETKQTFTLILWLIYVLYFHLRFGRGWSGHKTAYLIIFGFLFLLFTYFGINTLGKGLHNFV